MLHEKGDEPTTFTVLVSKEGGEIMNILLQAHVIPYKDEDREHCISQRDGQLISGLRAEVLIGLTGNVFSFATQCLLMVSRNLKVLAWLAYLRWKFKLLSTVLWYVESVSWIYNIQVVEQLMEHEWRLTKLQQNLKWQLHALPAQQCNPATTKVNDHALTEVHVLLAPIIQKLFVELIEEFVDSQRHVSKSSFSRGRRNKVYQAALDTGLELFLKDSIMCVHISVGVLRIPAGIFVRLKLIHGPDMVTRGIVVASRFWRVREKYIILTHH